VKYAQIHRLRDEHSVIAMCRLLGVSESGYYAWRKRPPSPRAKANARLTLEIKAAHERTRRTYGPERLQSELADNGIRVGVHRIKRIRREQGLRCKQKRRFRVTTDSKHTLPVAPNRLARRFSVDAPNKVWVTDLTYIDTAEGWLYLAGIKDLFNGELVGYAMSERMTVDLTETALRRAIDSKRPGPGLLHHSDRGSQYCAGAYQELLRQHQMQPSKRALATYHRYSSLCSTATGWRHIEPVDSTETDRPQWNWSPQKTRMRCHRSWAVPSPTALPLAHSRDVKRS
jgi:putative transposase